VGLGVDGTGDVVASGADVGDVADDDVGLGVDCTGDVVASGADVGDVAAGVEEAEIETDGEACVVMVTDDEDGESVIGCDVEGDG